MEEGVTHTEETAPAQSPFSSKTAAHSGGKKMNHYTAIGYPLGISKAPDTTIAFCLETQ